MPTNLPDESHYNSITPLVITAEQSAALHSLIGELHEVSDLGAVTPLIAVHFSRIYSFQHYELYVWDRTSEQLMRFKYDLPEPGDTPGQYISQQPEIHHHISGFDLQLNFKKTRLVPLTESGIMGIPADSADIFCLDLPLYQQSAYAALLRIKAERRPLEQASTFLSMAAFQSGPFIFNLALLQKIDQLSADRTALLDLCKVINQIKRKEDLFRIVEKKLKVIFQIDDYAICLLNESKNPDEAFRFNPEKKHKASSGAMPTGTKKFMINDGICGSMIDSDKPLVYNLDQMILNPTMPNWVKSWHDQQMREMVAVTIRDGVKKIGFFCLLAKQQGTFSKSRLSMLQVICAQLSVAISNILAAEKIDSQLEAIDRYQSQLEEEKNYLQQEIQTVHNYSEIIGSSENIKKVFQLVSQVAETTSSVLILGETGTGKELIARAIHNASLRKDKVMVKVNCATLPANLVESELFGHERGSFTGATDKRIGKFELANNSTIFLDEIGELPLELQSKLLRALQEKEIERIGGRSTIKINVRVIAATNRDLQQEVNSGHFRGDLFFRLNVFPIMIPPLRERRDDIPRLAYHFLLKHSPKGRKRVNGFSDSVIKEMTAYKWPGNVRELEHLVERSILLANLSIIDQVHLPILDGDSGGLLFSDLHIKTIDEVERDHIIAVLKECNGRVGGPGGAAELLRIPSTTLNSKIKRLGIK